MRYPRLSFIGAALPAAAILSLACGPSPSAAYAQANKSRARTHSTGQDAEPTPTVRDCSDRPGDNGASPISSNAPTSPKPRKPATGSSFVAPSSAKPSEGKVTELALTPAVRGGPVSGSACPSVPVPGDYSSPRPTLHRAIYLALAPPSG